MVNYSEKDFWEERYRTGQNSGKGSYGPEATFKVDYLVRVLQSNGCRSVLDLGCGDGNLAFELLKRLPNIEYRGVDISPWVISRNQMRNKSEGLSARFFVGDIGEPYQAFPADCVICLDVLFHIKDPKRHQAAVGNVLRLANKISVVSTWCKKPTDSLPPHCFYHEFSTPQGTETQIMAIPGNDSKVLHTLIKHHGFTIWFTGLPCSGKSTIAEVLHRHLQQRGPLVLLDGDAVRKKLCSDLGFTKEDRTENLRRVREMADILNKEGIPVITANITPYEQDRQAVYNTLQRPLLVWMDTPAELCEQRDVKGMWALARQGKIKGFTGVDDPFEAPKKFDLRLTPKMPIKMCANKILRQLKDRNWI